MGTQVVVAGIHLNNTTGTGVAGGATSGATTTPFVITSYKLLPAPSKPIWAGGAPFRDGRTLVAKNRDNVVEQLELMVEGSSRDNAALQIRTLDMALQTALFSTPAILSQLPHGMTNAAYAEVFSADVASDERLWSSERSSSRIRFAITWERTPFFGILSTGETIVNAATVNNTGTGSPDNIEVFSTGSGDLIYDGQPINVIFTPTTASKVVHVVYLASCYSRTYTTTGATTATTALIGGATINSTPIPFDVSAAITRSGLKPRCLVQFTALSAAAEVRLNVGYKNGLVFHTTPWTASASLLGNTSNVVIDFGTWPLPAGRRVSTMAGLNLDLYLDVRSTDGTSVTATFSFSELLLYYTFCRIDTLFASLASQNALPTTAYLLIDGFQEQTNVPCLPYTPQAWHVLTSGAEFRYPHAIRGTAPRYYSGASLYAAWMASADATTIPTRTTTYTATITARQAPLYRTIRGAG